MTLAKVRLLVSGLGGGLLLAHLIWPELRVDAVSFGLLVVVILPWLSPLVKSAELPGGWKVQFQDVETAAARITGTGPGATPSRPLPPPPHATVGPPITGPEIDIASTGAAWPVPPLAQTVHPDDIIPERTAELLLPDDPNLALIALRLSIEQRLQNLAIRTNRPFARNTTELIHNLQGAGLLSDEQLKGLSAVIQAADRAAHGASVDTSVARWARTRGLDILNAIDRAGRP